MSEIKLPPLTSSDINWIIVNSVSHQATCNAESSDFFTQEENLYFVLDGTLSVTVKQKLDKAGIANLFSSQKDKISEIEIMSLSVGDAFGDIFSLILLPASWVKVTQPATILALSRPLLQTKLQQDAGFASRLYRAIASSLLDRLDFCIDRWIVPQTLKLPSLQDIPLLFGELNDSDVDWIVESSRLEFIAKNTVSIEAGKPVDTVYLLLQGNVALEALGNPNWGKKTIFSRFDRQSANARSRGYEFARITRGEPIGEMTLLGDRLPTYTVKALENLQVLALNRQQLLTELDRHPTKAARFFRAIAMVLSARFQGLISQLENRSHSNRFQQNLSPSDRIPEEIDFEAMDNISLGGVRFNWMLKRLKISA